MEIDNEKKIGQYDVDYMELLYENDNISIYELDAIHLGVNRNNMSVDEECVNRSLTSFADMPLYCVIDDKYNPLDGEHNDFLEHFREEMPERISRDRILPFGTVPESAIPLAKLVERDGKTYLRLQIVVWKRLLPHVSQILQRRDGSVKISVEFIVDEFDVDKVSGIVNIRKFTITAITALGAKFTEVMEGAMLKSVKFSFSDYFDKCNDNYCVFAQNDAVEVPQGVIDSISEGLELRDKYGRGCSAELYNNMKAVVHNGFMSMVQVADMNAYFNSDEYKDVSEGTRSKTNKFIQNKVFGGEVGKLWCFNVYNSNNADVIENAKEGGENVENAMKKMKINNSKEAAVHSESWANPGKKLYEPLFEHSNVNELIYEAYLIAKDGFQEAPSEKLKYPHHVIKDGELVCDVAGVESALARAKQQGIFNDKEVWAHLHRHYKELDLNMEAFEEKNSQGEEGGLEDLEKRDSNVDIDYKVEIPDAGAKEDPKGTALDPEKVHNAELEQRCADLEKEKEEINAKLSEYVRKEEKEACMAMVNEYRHCFDEEKCAEMEKCAAEMAKDEFCAKLSTEVMAFAKSLKDKEKEDEKFAEPVKNAFYNFQKEITKRKETELGDVITRLKTKVN